MLFGKKKDKKKKKVPTERFLSLKANDVQVDAINFSLTKDKEGNPRLEVRTRDVCEALHYQHIDFELKTSVKMLKVGAAFKEAISEKNFKVYVFDVDDFSQFYI